jgi:hypothetical protein
VDDLHQATGRDLNLVVGRKHSATVGVYGGADSGNAQERDGGQPAAAGTQNLAGLRRGERTSRAARFARPGTADEHPVSLSYPRTNACSRKCAVFLNNTNRATEMGVTLSEITL